MTTSRHQQEQIGARIRELRLARGLTQERLAEAAEISAPYVAQIETGTAMPSVPVLLRIAGGLAVPVSGLASALDGPQEGEEEGLRAQVEALLAEFNAAQLRLLLGVVAAIRAEWPEEPAP